jgi:redox-sensitive bicupin YhaK (pirin superfamily)
MLVGRMHRHRQQAAVGHDPQMRIVEVSAVQPRAVERFGSRGFSIGTLCADAYVAAATLEPQGGIGRHPAVDDQCLVVIEGSATVSGEDGSFVAIEPGQAALWLAGEDHETRTEDGVRVLIIEGAGLADRLV